MSKTFRKSWSTDALPSGVKLAQWREVVRDSFLDLDIDSSSSEIFKSSIETIGFSELTVNIVNGAQQRVTLDRSAASDHGKHVFFVNFQIEGFGFVSQNDKSCEIPPGGWYILNGREPFELRFSEGFLSSSFILSNDNLGSMASVLENSTAVCYGRSSGIEKLFHDSAQVLTKHLTDLNYHWQARQLSDFKDMLGGCVQSRANAIDKVGPVRAKYERVLFYIKNNLEKHTLHPALIARECGLSLSGLHALFQLQNETVMRFVMNQRLGLAKDRLKCSSFKDKSISEIAYLSGFSDLAHFSKTFKVRYKCSPREFRGLCFTRL